jgi:nucleoside-diphosphate-sugar epimerase
MKTRVLVVGGNGFLGTNLVLSDSKMFEFVPLAKNDWSLPEVNSRINTVVFLRSISSPTYVHEHPIESEMLNIEQTSNFIDMCLKFKLRVIFTSSDVVYGDTGDSIVNENSPTKPYGLYAIQKAEIENRFSDSANFISLRLSLITGTGSKLRNILSKESSPAIADSFIRSPVNVKHVVNLIQVISGEQNWLPEHKVINVGGRAHISIFDLARTEAKLHNLNAPRKTLPTELDLKARPQTVRMYSRIAESLVGSKFGFE